MKFSRAVKAIPLLLPLLVSGCASQGISVDLNWLVGDSTSGSLVPEVGDPISCSSPRINEYAALHVTELQELREALLRGNIGETRIRRAAMAIDPENADEMTRETLDGFETIESELDGQIFRVLRNINDHDK